MKTQYLFGPYGFDHIKHRRKVFSFDEIPEPRREYCMMLDAAANEKGDANLGFCRRSNRVFEFSDVRVFYLFDPDFWEVQGGEIP